MDDPGLCSLDSHDRRTTSLSNKFSLVVGRGADRIAFAQPWPLILLGLRSTECRKSIYGYGWKKQARSAFLAVVHGLPLVASMPGSHSALFLPFASAERSDTTT
jgi:hypothetical protein